MQHTFFEFLELRLNLIPLIGVRRFIRALSSNSLKDLNDIIAKINHSTDIIEKEARLVEGAEAKIERQSAAAWRNLQRDDRFSA